MPSVAVLAMTQMPHVQLKSRSQEMEEVTGMQASISRQLANKERQLHSNSLELAGLKFGRSNQVQISVADLSCRSQVANLIFGFAHCRLREEPHAA